MSTGSISDALSRVSAIEQQLQQLNNGAIPGTDFANALASAEGAGSSTDTADSSVDGLLTGGVAVSTGASTTSTVALPTAASSSLTSNQQQFASTLSADTGLSPSVVSAWLLAEESGSAAQARQSAGNNDWLNIGYTDSGTYGASDSVWSDPVTAANATASWLQGEDSVAGYGTASAGVQSILSSVGQSPAAQIQAIQNSGWSSGGYPSLPSLYQSLGGSS